ncbi:MAG: DUF371 domain-containing protein [Candidatus Bathyarchaeota archaeon]|nr:DUF371 domain-containing protein [Candidatus Bathyarchaeota archaeon]
MPAIIEKIVAHGHPNISALHPTTLMFTKDENLTKKGDCIVAVGADNAVADFSEEFKTKLQDSNTKLTIQMKIDDVSWQVTARGSPKLSLTSKEEIVVRKSDFSSERTMAVCADKASVDMPREMVEKLKNPNQKVEITLTLA